MDKTISHSFSMKIMLRLPLLLLLFSCSTLSFGQVEIHDWTNKGGRTIKAKFVSGDASTVTIFLNGRNFVLKLSDLSEESKALARKLSGPPPSPSPSPAKPASSSEPEPSPWPPHER